MFEKRLFALFAEPRKVVENALPYFSASQTVQGNRSQRYYAQALLKICDLHQRLRQEGKSGIDVVCILWGIPHELFKNDDIPSRLYFWPNV